MSHQGTPKLDLLEPAGPYEREQVEKLDRATTSLLFLSEVSRRLSCALTDQACFQELIELMVPAFADWATFSLKDETGKIRRVGASHIDPEKAKFLKSLGNMAPSSIDDPTGPGYVIRTGNSDFTPEYDLFFEENVAKVDRPNVVSILRNFGVRSKICVPVEANGQIFGALWMATSESGRRFDQEDLKLAEEVASRAAQAAYHLVRFEKAVRSLEKLQVERDVREDFISQSRHDALSVLTVATLCAQMLEKKQGHKECTTLARRIVVAIEKASNILKKTRIGVC